MCNGADRFSAVSNLITSFPRAWKVAVRFPGYSVPLISVVDFNVFVTDNPIVIDYNICIICNYICRTMTVCNSRQTRPVFVIYSYFKTVLNILRY